MMLSEKFEQRCINPASWFRKNNLDADTGYRVLRGELTGQKNTKGNTREVFEALLKDGFIDELPSGLRENTKAS